MPTHDRIVGRLYNEIIYSSNSVKACLCCLNQVWFVRHVFANAPATANGIPVLQLGRHTPSEKLVMDVDIGRLERVAFNLLSAWERGVALRESLPECSEYSEEMSSGITISIQNHHVALLINKSLCLASTWIEVKELAKCYVDAIARSLEIQRVLDLQLTELSSQASAKAATKDSSPITTIS